MIVKSTDPNFIHRLLVNSEEKSGNVSSWSEGVYEVVVNAGGRLITAPFVVTRE